MDEILEMLEDQIPEEQTEQEMTDEQIEEQMYTEADEETEEVDVLEEGDEEAAEDEEEPEEEAAEEEPAHKARDEPSADELFAQQVRRAYGGMTDEQIVEAMVEAQAERMHAEDPEISVKAAKEIIKLRAQASGAQAVSKPTETDAHAEMLKEQAREMASTKEGAALLKEMLTDETVKAKIDSGAWDVKQARAYYEGKRESEAGAKRAPTTIKARGAVKNASKSVKNMSDAEFARLEARMDEAFEQGKRPRL